MGKDHPAVFECYREAVYARLRPYTAVVDDPDDHAVAMLARAELPRYVRYWMSLLTEHEPTADLRCPRCSRWWRAVSAPCGTWKWAHAVLTITPARTTVPPSRIHERADRKRRSDPGGCYVTPTP